MGKSLSFVIKLLSLSLFLSLSLDILRPSYCYRPHVTADVGEDNTNTNIHISNRDLLRAYKLRSGHCSAPNFYLVRVGRSESSTCPEWGVDDQTAAHLFGCPSRITDLRPIDLWLKPYCDVHFFTCTGATQATSGTTT